MSNSDRRYLTKSHRAYPDNGIFINKNSQKRPKNKGETEKILNPQFSCLNKKCKSHKGIIRSIYENARLTQLSKLNFRDLNVQNISRAGIIPYTFIKGRLYLCFGRDYETGELTDFGGTRKDNESVIECAVREGNEESRFVFGEIKEFQVTEFWCLHNSNMLIIFIPVDIPKNPDDEFSKYEGYLSYDNEPMREWVKEYENMDIREITRKNFEEKEFLSPRQFNTYCYNELTEIIWLSEAEVGNIFSDHPTIQMFSKVRRFIYSCNEFSRTVDQMKLILRRKFTFHPEDLPDLSNTLHGRKSPLIEHKSFNESSHMHYEYCSWISNNVLSKSQELFISSLTC